MDDNGHTIVVDRKSGMIVTGGLNVFPNEIEPVLSSHAAVQDCSVVGVPDEKWGEAVKAFVQLKRGQDVGSESLQALVRAQLGPVKTPRRSISCRNCLAARRAEFSRWNYARPTGPVERAE